MDPAEHVDLLDAFAGHADLVSTTGLRFDAWRTAVDALQRTQLSDREKQARIENRVISAAGHRQDRAACRRRRRAGGRARGAGQRRSAEPAVGEAYAALYDGDTAALATLAAVWKRVSDLARLDPRAQPYVDQRDDIKSRLEDLAFFLRGYRERLERRPIACRPSKIVWRRSSA
jgi:DNA repair ATPase RecN